MISTCHPNRKSKVRGLCSSCYGRELKLSNPDYHQRQKENSRVWKTKSPEKYQEYLDKQKMRSKIRSTDLVYKLQRRNAHIKRKYGIDLIAFNKILLSQDNTCFICKRAPSGNKPLHIDHNHETGKVRGLLCHQCNWYVGTIDSDPEVLGRLYEYLEAA